MIRKMLLCATVVAALISPTLVAAPPATANNLISGYAVPGKIDIGQYATLKGRLGSGRSGVVVIIDRGRNGRWYPYTYGRTTTNGYYAFRIKPTSSGRYAFRARVSTGTSDTFYLSVYKLTYLDEMRQVTCCSSVGSVQINGRTYIHGVYDEPDYYSSWERTEWDLARRGRLFNATVGLRDDADSRAQVAWEILGDGRVLASGTSRLGQAQPISVNVTNVLRLTIQFRYVTGSYYDGYLAFGNPVIRS